MAVRPKVVIATNEESKEMSIGEADLERLALIADVRYERFDAPSSWEEAPPDDPALSQRFIELTRDADAVIISHGAPRITPEIMDALPKLRFIGELEGDRFARRIDLEAAWERGIKSVDTTNGSSYGVSEWALMLAMLGLRDGGRLNRRIIIDRDTEFHTGHEQGAGYRRGELTGKTVGMIGAGHIGRRFLELLKPFRCPTFVHDPYVPRELADIYDVTFTSLDNVLSLSDVVVCLAPITPATRGMLGAREFALMQDDAVFVNVSRGAIVQSDALIAELQAERITACLDVFDPEPIPVDSPIRDLPNAFLTPHIAGYQRKDYWRFFTLMVDELERFIGGHETRYDLLPHTQADRTGAPPPARV
jgi:D-3-phosphoglycerate dehydrogenase